MLQKPYHPPPPIEYPMPTPEQPETRPEPRDVQYEETEQVPAIPKPSSYPGVSYPPYPQNNPCPFWHAPPVSRGLSALFHIGLERLAARTMWIGMGSLVFMVFAVLMVKFVVMIWVMK
jgi:hypothetical protein